MAQNVDPSFPADGKPTLTPITECKPGDVVKHFGLIAGQEWYAMITGIGPVDDATGKRVIYETGWPLVYSHPADANVLMHVMSHDEESINLFAKMFADDEES